MSKIETKRDRELYRQVFNKIIRAYEELKSINGSLSCTGLYQTIASQGSGKTSFNTSIIRATPSDFICEVERIAVLNLSYGDYRKYIDQYETKEYLNIAWKLDKHRIQEILGNAYIKSGIHPIEQYFKPRDIR